MKSSWLVAQGWEPGKRRVTVQEYGVSFWGGQDVLELTVMLAARLCDYTKNHRIIHFTLYLNLLLLFYQDLSLFIISILYILKWRKVDYLSLWIFIQIF